MMVTKETIYNVDASNKKISVTREFDAPVEKVWAAWTQPALLDQWWAPRPWKAVTLSMDFRNGGRWFYYMQGPEGERHHCIVDYKSIVTNKSITGIDAFADEQGNLNKEFPSMDWDIKFRPHADGTKVEVVISFDSEESMNKIVEMGFKEGFAAAHTNLDELLAAS